MSLAWLQSGKATFLPRSAESQSEGAAAVLVSTHSVTPATLTPPAMETAATRSSDVQSPSLMAEVVCSAMTVLLLFFIYRWWEQDRIYTRREQERDMVLSTSLPPSSPVFATMRRSTPTTGGTVTSGSAPRAGLARTQSGGSLGARIPSGVPAGAGMRRASSSAVLQESPEAYELCTAPHNDRQGKQERMRARAEYLASLIENPINGGHGSLDSPSNSGSDPSLGSPYRGSDPRDPALGGPYLAAGASGHLRGSTSVSSASRYTAQILKRRNSAAGLSGLSGSVSPVARTASGSSPLSRYRQGAHPCVRPVACRAGGHLERRL